MTREISFWFKHVNYFAHGCAVRKLSFSFLIILRFYLPLFFRRFRSDRRRRFFVRQWGARGAVASVRDKVLMVHI